MSLKSSLSTHSVCHISPRVGVGVPPKQGSASLVAWFL